ncbi:hypothetical protein [Arthrobacter sp. NIO-1057]|uniref:hypothetical protein n=1 Tax=Arthrobacter sp. NIO-1057 TaxID=993071 RepID=UPI000AE3D1DD|nr:hypothetical protein [Arthrobacter sp. NIO-1057]
MLSQVFVECFRDRSGLNAAYLPAEVNRGLAEEIVALANEQHGNDDYAFLVTSESDTTAKSSRDAVRYRQGQHLAVVSGRHPDLGSVTGVFSEALGASFPEGSSGSITLREVALSATKLYFRSIGLPSNSIDLLESCSTQLLGALNRLAEVLQALRQGTKPWNVQWYEAVDSGLKVFLSLIIDDKPSVIDVENYFSKYIFAAFGLPRQEKAKNYSAAVIAEAFKNLWSDRSIIENSAKMIGYADPGGATVHPVSEIGWETFDDELVIRENLALTFGAVVGKDPQTTKKFSLLTESQLTDPSRGSSDLSKLQVFTPDKESLNFGFDTSSDGPIIVRAEYDEWDCTYSTEEIYVHLSTAGSGLIEDVQNSEIKLVCSPKKYSWEGKLEKDEDGQLYFVGRVSVPANLPINIQPSKVSLKVEVPVDDVLVGKVDQQAGCTFYVVNASTPGLISIPLTGKKSLKAGKPSYYGPETLSETRDFEEGTGSIWSFTVEGTAAQYRYLAWGCAESVPTFEDDEFQSLGALKDFWYFDSPPLPLASINVGKQEYECRAEDSGKAPLSPIAAAIAKRAPSRDPLPHAEEQSIRGSYEKWIVENYTDSDVMGALGHIVMPEDKDTSREEFVPVGNGFLMHESLADEWPQLTDLEVPKELYNSVEANQFRESFNALKVGQIFRADADGRTHLRLSTVSWRHLWKGPRNEINDYLSAYADLIRASNRNGDPAGKFWAAYPFSISVWSTRDDALTKAVLLSPLHPIRLAWLAGAEATLWSSDIAEQLAGTVEGWNLPFFGPREEPYGRFMAVPMETGDEQVFLGWSMLVSASTSDPKTLQSPSSAAGVRLPGTAVSGLNATAVAAAMRSYKQINPHLSTLSVDLAAQSSQTRLSEVDVSVLREGYNWASDKNMPLRGGIRIWDSSLRTGEPPLDAIARNVDLAREVPMSWNRYSNESSSSIRSDIRILQDGGVKVRLRDDIAVSQLGALGDVPLRRYEAMSGEVSTGKYSTSSPTLTTDRGWQPFVDALVELEGASRNTVIDTRLFASQLANDQANWTVAGESLMNPSAMAEILRKTSSGEQMLWEWRPPFLESSKGAPVVERRPFVSIAKVPSTFRRQIRELLDTVTGNKRTSETLEVEILGRLGTRGVGLSSMLAMGATHASGALGFYLAFELMEKAKEEFNGTFVLPIDACDVFLRSLAGAAHSADSARRADLLLIRLEQGKVTLSPIEIKFYGVSADAESILPDSSSDALLTEAVEQANVTLELLHGVSQAWNLAQTDIANAALWSNGMAALVESAIRLNPVAKEELEATRSALQSVVDGKFNIFVGKPVVTYFRHKGITADGHSTVVQRVSEGLLAEKYGEYGLLAASANVGFEAANDENHELVTRWSELVNWSLAPDADLSGVVGNAKAALEIEPDDVRPEQKSLPRNSEASVDQDSSVEGFANPKTEDPTIDADSDRDRAEKAAPVNYRVESGTTSEPALNDEEPSTTNNSLLFAEHDGIRFKVGDTLGPTQAAVDFWPSNTRLNQLNVGVVGDLGTGKTQLLKSLIYQLREKAKGKQATPLTTLIFDYKRDFQDQDFLDSVGGKLLHIDNIPLNFFALRGDYTPMKASQKSNEFIDVLDKIYGGIGPIQKDRLQSVITDLYREMKPMAPTISEVLTRYQEDNDKPDSVTALLRKFVVSEIFSNDKNQLLSFEELMENNVVVVALNDFGTDDDGKNALVVLFLNLYYDYMLNSKKWPYVGSDPQLRTLNSYLLVDEAVNIMKYKFPVLMSLLLQGREFGVGIILASQYLTHFKQGQEDYAQPLLTWFVHKVPSISQKDLFMLGLTNKTEAMLQKIPKLEVHQAMYKSLDVDGKFIRGVPYFEVNQSK